MTSYFLDTLQKLEWGGGKRLKHMRGIHMFDVVGFLGFPFFFFCCSSSSSACSRWMNRRYVNLDLVS